MNKIVLIEWVDSAAYPGWRDIDLEGLRIATCTSVGYLLYKNKDEVCIFQSKSYNGRGVEHIDGQFAIPKGCIKRMEVIYEENE